MKRKPLSLHKFVPHAIITLLPAGENIPLRWIEENQGGSLPCGSHTSKSTPPPRVLESMGTWSGVVACSSWPRSAGSGSKVPLGVGCYDGPTYSPSWGPCTSRRQPRCPPNSSPTSASTTCTSTRGWGTSWSANNGIWRQPTEVISFTLLT